MKGSGSFPIAAAYRSDNQGTTAVSCDDACPCGVILDRSAIDIHVGTGPGANTTTILAAVLHGDIVEAANGAILAIDDIRSTLPLTGAARCQVVDRDLLRAIKQDRGAGPAGKIHDRRIVAPIEGDVAYALKHDIFIAHTAHIDDVGAWCVKTRKRPDGCVH